MNIKGKIDTNSKNNTSLVVKQIMWLFNEYLKEVKNDENLTFESFMAKNSTTSNNVITIKDDVKVANNISLANITKTVSGTEDDDKNNNRYAELLVYLAKNTPVNSNNQPIAIKNYLSPLFEKLITNEAYLNLSNNDAETLKNLEKLINDNAPQHHIEDKLNKVGKRKAVSSFLRRWVLPVVLTGGASAIAGAVVAANTVAGASAFWGGSALLAAGTFGVIGAGAALLAVAAYSVAVPKLTKLYYRKKYGVGAHNENLLGQLSENITAENIAELGEDLPIVKLIKKAQESEKLMLTRTGIKKWLNPITRAINRNRLHEIASFKVQLDKQAGLENGEALSDYINNFLLTNLDNAYKITRKTNAKIRDIDIEAKHIKGTRKENSLFKYVDKRLVDLTKMHVFNAEAGEGIIDTSEITYKGINKAFEKDKKDVNTTSSNTKKANTATTKTMKQYKKDAKTSGHSANDGKLSYYDDNIRKLTREIDNLNQEIDTKKEEYESATRKKEKKRISNELETLKSTVNDKESQREKAEKAKGKIENPSIIRRAAYTLSGANKTATSTPTQTFNPESLNLEPIATKMPKNEEELREYKTKLETSCDTLQAVNASELSKASKKELKALTKQYSSEYSQVNNQINNLDKTNSDKKSNASTLIVRLTKLLNAKNDANTNLEDMKTILDEKTQILKSKDEILTSMDTILTSTDKDIKKVKNALHDARRESKKAKKSFDTAKQAKYKAEDDYSEVLEEVINTYRYGSNDVKTSMEKALTARKDNYAVNGIDIDDFIKNTLNKELTVKTQPTVTKKAEPVVKPVAKPATQTVVTKQPAVKPQPATQPAVKKATQPISTQPAVTKKAEPVVKPVAKPATQTVVTKQPAVKPQPATKPTTQPAVKKATQTTTAEPAINPNPVNEQPVKKQPIEAPRIIMTVPETKNEVNITVSKTESEVKKPKSTKSKTSISKEMYALPYDPVMGKTYSLDLNTSKVYLGEKYVGYFNPKTKVIQGSKSKYWKDNYSAQDIDAIYDAPSSENENGIK